jgi:hypothetical protein
MKAACDIEQLPPDAVVRGARVRAAVGWARLSFDGAARSNGRMARMKRGRSRPPSFRPRPAAQPWF